MAQTTTGTSWRDNAVRQSYYDWFLEKEGIPVYRGNYVEDVYTLPLGDWKRLGGRGAYVNLANQQQTGAMILILSGSGYELMFKAGGPRERFELRPGSIISPGNMIYHQHVNPNPEPLRQLAFRGGTSRYGAGEGGAEAHMAEPLPYPQEDPAIRERFYAEC